MYSASVGMSGSLCEGIGIDWNRSRIKLFVCSIVFVIPTLGPMQPSIASNLSLYRRQAAEGVSHGIYRRCLFDLRFKVSIACIVTASPLKDAFLRSPCTWRMTGSTFRMFRLYAVLLLIYLCAALNGYDSSLMPAINGMSRL